MSCYSKIEITKLQKRIFFFSTTHFHFLRMKSNRSLVVLFPILSIYVYIQPNLRQNQVPMSVTLISCFSPSVKHISLNILTLSCQAKCLDSKLECIWQTVSIFLFVKDKINDQVVSLSLLDVSHAKWICNLH